MEYTRGRYSWLLRPFLIIFDLAVVNILAFYYFNFNDQNLYFFSSAIFNNKHLLYILYSIFLWMLTTSFINFYRVYRYTSALNIASLLVKQFFLFSVIVYAFIGLFRSINIQAFVTLKYLLYVFACISSVKLLSYYILKSYRSYLKGNLRNVVIIGSNFGAKELETIFKNKKQLGYNLLATFESKKGKDKDLKQCFEFLEDHKNIDEIYCSIDDLTENQVNQFVKYANINHCNIKFIPNTKKLYTNKLKTDYYNYLPVLSIPKVSLNQDVNKFLKRTFDVFFSIFIIVFVLSWVYLILFVLIKLESKGPVIYKHKRNGINYKEFYCYKFRSLKTFKEVQGTYVKQNDSRVTRIGKFIRRTSIDELPQFVNVLLGEMSVVGPRPHMLSYTEEYSKKIDKYNFIFRHNVKPGVTGLAQVKGYRGEIKNDEDIVNRVKFDIFYIENWSLFLDIKIILQTISHIVKGQKEAY
ncbi:exopolysaccharide biosynthesis polyprenyl glycosylphosphotransferase [Lacinutrix sp. 5H-3-7-4]|uniref:exopolysaccharide biosynthesis polyprenyl glycosylphosphotransferase n=1 Tax=Lacinutrix sp. (strain 5H-3-7-4) TaxID=983544 RepID=UPI00020A38B4|nr:exopolysaccharide biosynthesis polyprenyl glycosylphosphotransferase [Lacinutrix sp. 5H-3-7-4]AEH00897.1 exopolysaccharide biosynthesis polyprenyl glycosylphosphotransferase [Lacinutrix sp. 5H-3-7-4]